MDELMKSIYNAIEEREKRRHGGRKGMKNYIYTHNGFTYIVSADTFSAANYRLYRHALGTGYQGSFIEFLESEFRVVEKDADEAKCREMEEKEGCEWI